MKTYPAGTVRKLLETDSVTEPTREALEKRLGATKNYQPAFFDEKDFSLLQAVCRRLIAQSAVDCAAFIDQSLSQNQSDGWRYDALPSDAETFRSGLKGINETAKLKFGEDFQQLNDIRQDEILTEIQNGKVKDGIWKKIPGELFFEELLAKTVEVYYSHPLAQEEIGYVGMADVQGWTQVRLDELEPREPRAVDR